MIEVVGVRFKQAGKVYYFSPGDFDLALSDKVIVETTRGIEFGEIVIPPRPMSEQDLVLPLKLVIRKAGLEDEQTLDQNKVKEKEAFQVCLKKIMEHRLPMKLVDVEYTFDGNKIVFSFTADGRVDFRELVKDLAAVFRTRIELRQIGVRDEAKMIGGVGSCGRILCCASFLGDFEPVSIRMAKDQKLSLNPTKISGICGRLMCCLKYENDCYGGCGSDCGNESRNYNARDRVTLTKEESETEFRTLNFDDQLENNEGQDAKAQTVFRGKGAHQKKGEKPRGKSEKV